MALELVPDRYRLHADICKVLTDPKRLMLLEALRSGERTVGDLAAALGISLPNASQHLAVMRGAGLVEGRREGTVVHYRIAEPTIIGACDIVNDIVERRLARRTAADPAALAAAPTPFTGTSRPPA